MMRNLKSLKFNLNINMKPFSVHNGFSLASEETQFSGIQLPSFSQIPFYTPQPRFLCDQLSTFEFSPEQLPKKRGAPVKAKNEMAAQLALKNTQEKNFKFSFIPQILVSHLHHLFDMKKKSRYYKFKWLRSYTQEGLSIQRQIFGIVQDNKEALKFKRTVSVKELKAWLNGELFCERVDKEETSLLRIKVFRLLCILKTVDLKNQFQTDFSVHMVGDNVHLLFRKYLISYMWQELNLPEISEAEIYYTFN